MGQISAALWTYHTIRPQKNVATHKKAFPHLHFYAIPSGGGGDGPGEATGDAAGEAEEPEVPRRWGWRLFKDIGFKLQIILIDC